MAIQTESKTPLIKSLNLLSAEKLGESGYYYPCIRKWKPHELRTRCFFSTSSSEIQPCLNQQSTETVSSSAFIQLWSTAYVTCTAARVCIHLVSSCSSSAGVWGSTCSGHLSYSWVFHSLLWHFNFALLLSKSTLLGPVGVEVMSHGGGADVGVEQIVFSQ